jgi:hypothetical protein
MPAFRKLDITSYFEKPIFTDLLEVSATFMNELILGFLESILFIFLSIQLYHRNLLSCILDTCYVKNQLLNAR